MVSGYFRTRRINADACSFGLLRPCSQRSSVRRLTYPMRSQREAPPTMIPHRLHARQQFAEEATLRRGFGSLATPAHS